MTTLGSLMLSALIAHAQDAAAPVPETKPADATQVASADAQPAAPAETAPAPAAAPEAAAPAPEPQPVEVAQVAAADTQPAETNPASAPAPDVAAAPAVAPVTEQGGNSAIIPLIVIDDTPLLDAIRNLARQAGINLMIDPKVAYGQPGADGKPAAQPNVSIRWENITAQQAFNALLNNYGLQAIEDPKVKITRITVKDPAAPDPLVTRTIQLQYAGPSNVLSSVTASLSDKRSKVVADVRTSQLVVVATEKEQAEVEALVAKLDSPTKQVLIEARLVETSMNPKTIKGIDWSGTLAKQNVRFGNNALPGISPTPSSTDPVTGVITPGTQGTIGGILGNPGVLMNDAAGAFAFNPATAFLNADGLSATLSFLNNNNEAKILASPRTVTLDNEPAHIEAGTLYPIVNVTAGTSQTTGGSQVNYSNLTVRLDVTPRISANNLINLKVTPSVMRLEKIQSFESGANGTFDVPVFATRTADTRVMIPSGNTLVMGGLISDTVTESNVKVPILGDLPVLGLLFRQDGKSREKGNLIVFITPTIVQDGDFQPTQSTYLKTPVPTDEAGDAEWSAWDNGKPRDWSKKGVKGGAVMPGPASN